MLKEKISLPTRNEVDNFKKSLLPQSLTSDDEMTGAEIEDLVSSTVQAILHHQMEVL